MILSKRTLGLLEHCEFILSSKLKMNEKTLLCISKGSILRASDNDRKVLFEADVEEVFPTDFSIYDLKEFLSLIKYPKNPNIDFSDERIIVRKGRTEATYGKGELFIKPYCIEDGKVNSEPLVSFYLTEKVFEHFMRMVNIANLRYWMFQGDDESGSLFLDASIKSGSIMWSIPVKNKLNSDNWFLKSPLNCLTINKHTMILYPSDYKVTLYKEGAYFESLDSFIRTWIPLNCSEEIDNTEDEISLDECFYCGH
jgi:hypothetical protein